MNKFELLFSPLTIKNVTLKNRVVMPPMGTEFATSFGAVTQRLIAYQKERAAGGVGLNIVEHTVVESRGKLSPHMLGIYDDAHIAGLKSLVETVHDEGGKIGIQLGHGGRRAASSINGCRPIAPSAIPELEGEVPHEMTRSQIDYIQDCWRKAARRAKQAGFDVVEIHMAHGYLIHQFLSPLTNKRTDRYGGNLENRSRFALEILSRVREEVGEEYPIFCRIIADEFVEGGYSIVDAKRFAQLLERGGADVIDVSMGVPESAERTIPPMFFDHGCNVDLTKEIKQQVNIPVICVGRIIHLEEAETVLQQKAADLVAMGRAHIADPRLVQKELAGGNSRPCIGCNQGCIDRLYQGVAISCLVNARVGKEYQIPSFDKVKVSKKIAVIGGGPAGLEFARVAAERGHKVTIIEKEAELGGRFLIGSIPPKKGDIQEFLDYLVRSLQSLGVEIKTGVTIEPEDFDKLEDFDEIVIAVGGAPIDILHTDAENVYLAEDVLKNKTRLGPNVLVIGGGMVGCETADWIASNNSQVTLVELLPDIAMDMEPRTRTMVIERLYSNRVEIICNTTVERIENNSVICSQNGLQFKIDNMDQIILALGYKAANPFNKVQSEKVHRIGDCVQSRKAFEAVHEGFLLGCRI
jgi:2,4-dienoyl-CoA reductase-like NADH-dependent reductase (Old Yellow Enzyme family)/thioredoxin reductase